MTKVTLKEIRDGFKSGIVLYFVHADWCPYTVQFYPIFKKVMQKLKINKNDKHFKVIRIDDTMVKSIRANYNDIHRKLAEYDEEIDEYKLYFPTVVMFVNGKRYKYKVDVRTVKNFEEFIVNKLPKQLKTTRLSSQSSQSRQKKHVVVSKQTHVGLQEQIDKAFKKLFN